MASPGSVSWPPGSPPWVSPSRSPTVRQGENNSPPFLVGSEDGTFHVPPASRSSANASGHATGYLTSGQDGTTLPGAPSEGALDALLGEPAGRSPYAARYYEGDRLDRMTTAKLAGYLEERGAPSDTIHEIIKYYITGYWISRARVHRQSTARGLQTGIKAHQDHHRRRPRSHHQGARSAESRRRTQVRRSASRQRTSATRPTRARRAPSATQSPTPTGPGQGRSRLQDD